MTMNSFDPFKGLPSPPAPDPLPPDTPWWGVGVVRVLTYLAWAAAFAILLLALGFAYAAAAGASPGLTAAAGVLLA